MDLDTAKRKAPGVAVLCSLVAPFLGFIVAGMALMGVKIRSYVAGPLIVWSVFSIALAAVLLARRRGAHWVAVGLVLFGFVFSEVVTSPDEPTGVLQRKRSGSGSSSSSSSSGARAGTAAVYERAAGRPGPRPRASRAN